MSDDVIKYDDNMNIESDLSINLNRSIYRDECYTQDYIENLFNSIESLCFYYRNGLKDAISYFDSEIEIDTQKLPELKNVDLLTVGLDDLGGSNYIGSASYKTGIVSVSTSLNIRASAGLDGNIIGSFKNNTKLKIVGQSNDGLWYKVDLGDGKTGWVSSKYVKNVLNESYNKPIDLDTSSIEFNGNKNNLGRVKVSTSLNIRASAGLDGSIIGSLKNNTELKIIDQSNDGLWYKVDLGDERTGWVYSKYVDLIKT